MNKVKLYIIDNNEIEYISENNESEIEKFVKESECSLDNLRDKAEEILQDFYELSDCKYGNPIEQLLPFIPDDNLKPLIEDYNYVIFNNLDDAKNYVKKQIENQLP